MVFPSEDDSVIGGPESWLDTSAVYGPSEHNPPKMDMELLSKLKRKVEDMGKPTTVVKRHIDNAIGEVELAKEAAYEDIKRAADGRNTGEVRALLDMIDDLESIQESLEEWQ